MSISTTKDEVLDRVLARLIDQVSNFNESTCFLSVNAEPVQNTRHNLYAKVSPTAGSFEEGVLIGGGVNTVFYDGGVAVTVFSDIKLDRVDHDSSLMNDESRGLFVLETKILKALAGYMLTNSDGSDILTAHMFPLNDTSPQRNQDPHKHGDFQLVFSTNFDWDMS